MTSLPVDLDAIQAQREADRGLASTQDREEVAEVRDVDAGGVACRYYRPAVSRLAAGAPRTPSDGGAGGAGGGLVVHLHGGGFVFNDIDVHDAACRRFANRSGLDILSVDYRLAPEHPFPAARDDVDTVLAWLDDQTAAEGIARSGAPTYVHGDSAGAALALVAGLRHPGRFAAMVLIYPFLDPTASFGSYDEEADDEWGRDEAAWYWQQYAPDPSTWADPDLAPLLSTRLATLPPTLVVTAGRDILRDEGEHLAAGIAAAGVEVQATRYLALPHGFWRHHHDYPAADTLMRQVSGYLAARTEADRARDDRA